LERFSVIAELKTPIIFGGGYCTLDALLGSILFEDLKDVDAAHAAIPIKCSDGLFHASAAIIEPFDTQPVSFVANLRADHAIHPDLLLKNKQGLTHRRMGRTRRRDYGAVLNKYKSISTHDVTWFAEGDLEKTRELLEDISFIGKRRGSGFGEVKTWRFEPSSLDGLLDAFDAPVRPIPIDRIKGDESWLKLDTAWRPAYWHPENRAICYAPEPLA